MRRKGRDSGAAALQYAGLIVLAGLILGSLVAIGLPGKVRVYTRWAICRILGGSCRPPAALPPGGSGTPGDQGTPSPGPSGGSGGKNPPWAPEGGNPVALPNSCAVSQDIKATTTTGKLVLVRATGTTVTVVQLSDDGSVSTIGVKQNGKGLDLHAGIGIGWGTVADATIGVSALSSDKAMTVTTFPSERAHAWFDREKKDRMAEKTGNPWTLGLLKSPKYSEEEVTDQLQKEWNAEHPDAPIKRAVMHADGTDNSADADVTFGPLLKANAGVSQAEFAGSRVDDMGTPDDPGDDQTTAVYERWDNLYGEFGSETYGKHGFGVDGRIYGRRDPVSITAVTYKGNKPIKLDVVSRRQWVAGARLGLHRGKGNPQKGNWAGGRYEWSKGGVSLEETIVDLTEHPEAARQWEAANGPGGGDDAAKALNESLASDGITTRIDYTRRQNNSGWAGTIADGLEWASAGHTSVHEEWSLDDAEYRKPGEKEWRPWVTCADGG